MGKPHKHAEFIKAWADGADIQYFSQIMNQWVDLPLGELPTVCTTSYRIKPKMIKFRLMKWYNSFNGSVIVMAINKSDTIEWGKSQFFRGWIGDWQEIEA